MTTLTKPVYEIDQETGLPALPEGLFWRVGESEDYSESRYTRTTTGVSLMRKREPLVLTKKVPEYGVNWLGMQSRKPVAYSFVDEVQEQEPEEIDFERFERRNVLEEAHLPSFAENVREFNDYGRKSWMYSLPLSKESIAFLADVIWIRRLRTEEAVRERARKDAEIDALKDKFFGDYPPKTLVGA